MTLTAQIKGEDILIHRDTFGRIEKVMDTMFMNSANSIRRLEEVKEAVEWMQSYSSALFAPKSVSQLYAPVCSKEGGTHYAFEFYQPNERGEKELIHVIHAPNVVEANLTLREIFSGEIKENERFTVKAKSL